jgi:hypothetical protein
VLFDKELEVFFDGIGNLDDLCECSHTQLREMNGQAVTRVQEHALCARYEQLVGKHATMMMSTDIQKQVQDRNTVSIDIRTHWL